MPDPIQKLDNLIDANAAAALDATDGDALAEAAEIAAAEPERVRCKECGWTGDMTELDGPEGDCPDEGCANTAIVSDPPADRLRRVIKDAVRQATRP